MTKELSKATMLRTKLRNQFLKKIIISSIIIINDLFQFG